MKITKLTLKNFGVYLGEQCIDLGSMKDNKPIVLVGGENGRGKTTIIEAIYLVLYGKLSPHANKLGVSYRKYLESRINDRASDRTATIVLSMQIQIEGLPTHLEITRTWSCEGSKQNDHFWVRRDGMDDEWLTENWLLFWPRILPSDIAELFFFDGERIEALADTKTSSQVIQNSLNVLFGLSPIRRLKSDLEIVQKRSIKMGNKGNNQELTNAYKQYQIQKDIVYGLEEKCVLLTQLRANKLGEIDQIRRKLNSIGGGSEILRSRGSLREKLIKLKYQANDIENQLRTLAEGNTPLLIIQELVHRTGEELRRANDENNQRLKREIIKTIQMELENRLFNNINKGNDHVLQITKSFFQEKLKNLLVRGSQFPKSILHQSIAWPRLIAELKVQKEKIRALLENYSKIIHEIEKNEARLMALPAEDTVRGILETEIRLHNELREIDKDLETRIFEKETAKKLLHDLRIKYGKEAEKIVRIKNDQIDAARITKSAYRTQELLDELEAKLIKKHISRLEIELTEKLALLHTKKLVHNVRILPDTFEIQLSTKDNVVIPASRLSAGERQLLALAVLWAIQSYSDRKMPIIVDTPLGRLDTNHRKNLVERFLTEASHQVIVLSTDSEVTPELIDLVSDSVGAQFTLHYEPILHSTRIEQGYFGNIEDRSA